MNPFSSKHIQPGAIPYYFSNASRAGDASIEALLKRIRSEPGCYGLVGPHGTGKSTLLANLAEKAFGSPATAQSNGVSPGIVGGGDKGRRGKASDVLHRNVLWLRPRGSPVRNFVLAALHWKHNELIFVDGFEQLPWIFQRVARWRFQWLNATVVVTSHRPLRGFETLWETAINDEIERYVVSTLLGEENDELHMELLASEEWRQSRGRHRQNLRESLFDMYDWWRCRKAALIPSQRDKES